MKRLFASIITVAAASAFVFPMHVSPPAVKGCEDAGYVYNVSTPGADRAPVAAKDAKRGFCGVASFKQKA